MDAVVDLNVVGWDIIYLPVQFCGGFFELWWDAFGPAFGSEASQRDRHQCDRWDSAQCRAVGDGESDRVIVQRHALLADPIHNRYLLGGRCRGGGELFAGARRDNPSVPVGGGR